MVPRPAHPTNRVCFPDRATFVKFGGAFGYCCIFFFFSSRRRHTRLDCDWSSDVCSSDLDPAGGGHERLARLLVAGRADRVADEELATRGDAAGGGLVAGDAPGGLVEVGVCNIDDIGVGRVDRDIGPVGGGDRAGTGPGDPAVGGAQNVSGGRASVEDDRVDLAILAVGDAGVAAGRLHAVGRSVARGPGHAAVLANENADAGDARVVRGTDDVHAVGRVHVDLELVLVAAEQYAVAHAHVGAVVGGQHL